MTKPRLHRGVESINGEVSPRLERGKLSSGATLEIVKVEVENKLMKRKLDRKR